MNTKINKNLSIESNKEGLVIKTKSETILLNESEIANLVDFVNDYMEEKIRTELKNKQREKEEKKNKKEKARLKTLEKAIDTAKKLGIRIIERPRVAMGTTEDRTKRILAIGPELESGDRWALIWYAGGSYWDNGGKHYVESWLDIVCINYSESGNKHYNHPTITRPTNNSERHNIFKSIEWIKHKEKLNLDRNYLIQGGQLTGPRLREIEHIIKLLIPNFVAFIPPWSHTIIYN